MSYCMAVAPALAMAHSLPYTNPLHTVGLGSVVESGIDRLRSRVRFPSGSFFPGGFAQSILSSSLSTVLPGEINFQPDISVHSYVWSVLRRVVSGKSGSRVDTTTLPQYSGLPSLSENSFYGSLFVSFATWGLASGFFSPVLDAFVAWPVPG